ncbi:MAG: Global regulator protein family [Gammaproteobacteria bacterium]|jgi:carbon storage regulator CsrA|nr:Global regulator protein family [Gammaproteobacteria bacterium]
MGASAVAAGERGRGDFKLGQNTKELIRMLIITRRPGESFFIGENLEIRVTLMKLSGNQIRVGIDAPPSFHILREELIPIQKALNPLSKINSSSHCQS